MSFFNKQAAWESRTLNDYLSGNDDPTWLDDLETENLPTNPDFVVDDQEPQCWPCQATKGDCNFVNGHCTRCSHVLLSHFLKKSGWTQAEFDRWVDGKEPF